MKRIIVDYNKLTKEVLSLLVEKYPDGYGDKDIISFKNTNNEIIEALEIKTKGIIYLVKTHTSVVDFMEKMNTISNEV